MMKLSLIVAAAALLSVATSFAGYRPAEALKSIPADAKVYGFVATSKMPNPLLLTLKKEALPGWTLAEVISACEPRFKTLLKDAGIDTTQKDLLEYIDLATYAWADEKGSGASYYISGDFDGYKLLKALYQICSANQKNAKAPTMLDKENAFAGSFMIDIPLSGDQAVVEISAKAGSDYIIYRTGIYAKPFTPMTKGTLVDKLPQEQGRPTSLAILQVGDMPTSDLEESMPGIQSMMVATKETPQNTLLATTTMTYKKAEAAALAKMQATGLKMAIQGNFMQQSTSDSSLRKLRRASSPRDLRRAKIVVDLLESTNIHYQAGSKSFDITANITPKLLASLLSIDAEVPTGKKAQ